MIPPHEFATLLLPIDASAHGPALDRHLLLNLWIILVLAVVSHLLLFGGLLLRRKEQLRSLRFVEVLPVVALGLLLAGLGVRAERLWAASRYTGADPSAMQVEVTGMQFAWYFRYPGPDAIFGATKARLASAPEGNPVGIDPADANGHDDLVSSELVLPENREVDLRLRAQDVIHGFSIPELRLKQNAIPGETVHVHFTPTKAGTYAILCTQLCGLGHYRMNATLRVVPETEFNEWLAAKERAAHP